uniref:Uncharacterized protein n=1 Tax=Anguilla anguilla TaxID=7936 RepID=A0A0E9UN87_ANGAN
MWFLGRPYCSLFQLNRPCHSLVDFLSCFRSAVNLSH